MSSFELEVSFEISSAHALRGYDGPCARKHGHNWYITLYAVGDQVDAMGFCLDFKVLKNIGKKISDQIDHRDLNEIAPFTEINPTAENLARWLYEQASEMLDQTNVDSEHSVRLSAVRLRETSRCAVTYRPSASTTVNL